MIIRDYETPLGRELLPKPAENVIYEVKSRFLTPEERRVYSCENLKPKLKICRCCGEEKADYRFFPNAFSDDGLSLWCKACWLKKQQKKAERTAAKRRKGRRNRDAGKQLPKTHCG